MIESEEYTAEEFRRLDAELCRMRTWEDQIKYGIIKCAECDSTICDCNIDLFDEVNGGISQKKKDSLAEILKEREAVNEIMREYFQRTGFSLDRDEVEKRVLKEREKEGFIG